MVVLEVIFIGAGLLVFRYASQIAGQISAYVSPPPDGENPVGAGFDQTWYLPYVVWGFGFTLIGLGGNFLRTALTSSFMGSSAGTAAGSMEGMSPDVLDAYMQQALSATRGATAQPSMGFSVEKEIIKIKCRNCGNLEPEDAAYCRKCGKPM